MKATLTITDNDVLVFLPFQVADLCKVRTDTSFLVFLIGRCGVCVVVVMWVHCI